jgi:hypothetical protein
MCSRTRSPAPPPTLRIERGGSPQPLPSSVLTIRPAAESDVEGVAPLIISTPGGLLDLLRDRRVALRVARAAFRARRSGYGYERALVADVDGSVAGQIIRFSGEQWATLRTRTGLVMVRAAGPRRGLRLIRHGRTEERMMPPIAQDSLYVLSLGRGYRAEGTGHRLCPFAPGGGGSPRAPSPVGNPGCRRQERGGHPLLRAGGLRRHGAGPRPVKAWGSCVRVDQDGAHPVTAW